MPPAPVGLESTPFVEISFGLPPRPPLGRLGVWVVSAFSIGFLFAPRPTRFIASVLSALTIADFLQIAYKAAEEKGFG